ncbi:MAG: A/G-specific adenine glycosylase [Candidatus Limnocylindrales bacterium]
MSSPPREVSARLPAPARDAILAWYGERGRPLAFRRSTDPYAILVSEAMAQQTQAARAAEYWERFMVRFPTVDSLAGATPADVLRAWAGLGYDRRALALWRTARVIVERHGGLVPREVAALEALPGVGPYTARAVAALAYGLPVGAVDVNVRRVLGRIVAGDPGRLTAAALQVVADDAVPADQPGIWTHAVMDVGATVCKPRRPRCEGCPAQAWCRFAAEPPAAVEEPTPPRAHRTGESPAPFASTNRWLRGRILDRLRAVADDGWTTLDGPIGEHGLSAVLGAARTMAADGVLELQETNGTARARLPLG